MAFDPEALRAVIFDYGNTLIRFGQAELEKGNRALIALLERHCGTVDRKRFAELRHADRLRPYRDGCRENRVPEIFIPHIRELFGQEPTAELLEAMQQTWFDSFVDAIKPLPWSAQVLDRLRGRHKLAVLSNYPSGEAIRVSLERVGLAEVMDVVVSSGDVGYVKPHHTTFEAVLDELGVTAGQALHVGDNWLADVQGAKRNGLWACHLTQYESPERFEAQPEDRQPDLTLAHLNELPAALGL